MKIHSAFVLMFAGLVAAASPAFAQGTGATGHAHKKTHAHKPPAHKAKAATPKEAEPDIAGKHPDNFNCELGDRLTIYRSPGDDQHVTLWWHKHLHEMDRVATTTGAERFENAKDGLVWIGIPAKSMLLDSKHGHQLANECRDAQQDAALRQSEQLARGSR